MRERLAQDPLDGGQRVFPVFGLAPRRNLGVADLLQKKGRSDIGARQAAVRILQQLVEPVLNDPIRHLIDQHLLSIGFGVGRLRLRSDGFDAHRSRAGFFLQMIKDIQPAMVELAEVRQGARRRAGRHGRELGRDQIPRLIGVELADHDQNHPLRPVPGIVKLTQTGLIEGQNRLLPADRKTARRQGSRQFESERGLGGSVIRRIARSFLGKDDFLLFFYLVGKEQRPFGVVPQHPQRLGHAPRIPFGEQHIVDGLGKTGVRIGVRAEPHADPLEVFDQLIRFETGGAVEKHMFQEMRDALLFFIFAQRSGLNVQVHADTVRGGLVLSQNIAEPIGETAQNQIGGDLQIGGVMRPIRFLNQRQRRRLRPGGQGCAADDHRHGGQAPPEKPMPGFQKGTKRFCIGAGTTFDVRHCKRLRAPQNLSAPTAACMGR